MKATPYIRTITLLAGELSDTIDGIFNSIYLKSATSGTGLHVKFDSSDFVEFPSNFGMTFTDEHGANDTFKRVRIKNTSGSSITFVITLFLGSGMDNNNVVVDGGSVALSGNLTIADITGQTLELKVDDDATQTLLATMDAVLDLMKTALDGIKTACEAIETNTDAMVVDLAAIELTQDQIVTNTTP